MPLRWLLTGAAICAAFVLANVGQLSTNPSELHRVINQAAFAPPLYVQANHVCQGLLHRYEHATARRPWCGELAYQPGFNRAPSIVQAARMGFQEFADPTNGEANAVQIGPKAEKDLDWRWNYQTGLWGAHSLSHWWQSALALRTLVRYAEETHDTDPGIHTILMRTYQRENGHTPEEPPFAIASDDFVNPFMDDTAWWGLAWLEASKYELTVRHDVADAGKFLHEAQYDATYVEKSQRSCGGVEWQIGFPTDTITNAEYITLAAALANYLDGSGPFHDAAGGSTWLTQATSQLQWLENHRLINVRTGYVHDSLNAACNGLIAGPITYTEGQVADALVQIGAAKHDPRYYKQANNFLHYVVSKKSGMVDSHGIVLEPCERDGDGCTNSGSYLDMLPWKGILIQGFSDYAAATGDRHYNGVLRRQAWAVVHNSIVGPNGQPGNCDMPSSCQFVFYWSWPLTPSRPEFVNQATQMDALDALTAVVALTPHKQQQPF